MTPRHSLFSLKGRIALITGASRGLGLEMARGLAAFGAHVLVNGRDEQAAAEAAATLKEEGLSSEPLAFDVTDGPATQAAFRQISDRHGRLDILINNAAIRHRAKLDDISQDDYLRVLEVNLAALFRTAKLAAGLMEANGGGRIIFISSVSAAVAPRGDAAYVSAKGGVNALMRALAVELADRGITCNAIAPGSFLTEINRPYEKTFASTIETRVPMQRWGQPHELAGPAIFLASEAASYVTGQVLTVDGGLTASYS